VPQRILVHDYSGHPFQPQLSRRLSARGHEVLHVYSQSVLIPQGALTKSEKDPKALHFAGIRLPAVIDKQAYFQRFFQERAYGQLLDNEIRKFRPDVVISSSTPLDAQASAIKAARAVAARFVFWLQDLQGIAIEKLLGARYNGAGRMVGRYYTGKEKRLLCSSDAVIAITEDFAPMLEGWGVDADAVHVIPNWASMEELPARQKDNPWARVNGLAEKFCFLYSGTIGLKHNPELMLKLALEYRDRPDVVVVVVSEGAKTEWLRQRKAELGLDGLRIFPFQPYADVPDVMGTADVLVAVLDAEAGRFSVPSKVLAYHCAGRPLLLAVPSGNLASRIVTQARSGLVLEPLDAEGFVRAADSLRASPELRERLARNALHYARKTFDLDQIADRFESLFLSLENRIGRARIELDEEEMAHDRA
jgi:colanic acid biosynthesis glycosyl transferase WcaI